MKGFIVFSAKKKKTERKIRKYLFCVGIRDEKAMNVLNGMCVPCYFNPSKVYKLPKNIDRRTQCVLGKRNQ